MTRTIILAAAEPIACPKCAHAFPLSEGISAQTIERYAEAYDRGFAERAQQLEAQLAAEAAAKAARSRLDKAREEAKALAREQFETEVRSMKEALAAKEGALSIREAGIWVARFEAARPLAEALRTTLIEMHKLRLANSGRSEKMELLYNYICSPQFAQRIKSVVDVFEAMRQDLEAERSAMTRIWKRREAQLTRLSGGMLGVVGDLQGIGEEAVPQLGRIAELPGGGSGARR